MTQTDTRSNTEAVDLVTLDALTVDGTYLARRTELVKDTTGVPVAQLSMSPGLPTGRTIDAQRAATPLPSADLRRIVDDAADRFAKDTIAGLDFEDYVRLAARVSGLPLSMTRTEARLIVDQCRGAWDSITAAQPAGATLDWRGDTRMERGGAVWARRGSVYGVHASGNVVGLLGFWIEALFLGYRVVIRPSRREPFTAHRLVTALRESGLRPVDVTYLPSDYAGADEILRSADLSMVYGGQAVVDKYRADPTVFANGPGRSKILVTADTDWRDHLDTITRSISHHGGMGCVNASAILVEGDPTELAHAVGERLAAIRPLPSMHPDAVLPVQPIERARALADLVAHRAGAAIPVLGADQIVAPLDAGTAALRPAVHVLREPDSSILDTEVAFPCVWIAPWSRTDGIAPLRNSLVVSALTRDEDLIDALVDEPTITNVYTGDHPTYEMTPTMPHDGYPADFFMRSKGFIRDARP